MATQHKLERWLCLIIMIGSLLVFVSPISSSAAQAPSSDPNQKHLKVPVKYHGGPLLTAKTGINVYLIWYGKFSKEERATITDFFASFGQPSDVATWWKFVAASYKDKDGNPVSNILKVGKEVDDDKYSMGKDKLSYPQIEKFVKSKIDDKTLPADDTGIYLVLTDKDVHVDQFCQKEAACGFLGTLEVSSSPNKTVAYAVVGDPSVQCPDCAYPYAIPPGMKMKPLVSPNGIGVDGMVKQIATGLIESAIDPFSSGYFVDSQPPIDTTMICAGIFGDGAYPGKSPGKLPLDKSTNASYNALGVNGKKFLLPAIWNPKEQYCMIFKD